MIQVLVVEDSRITRDAIESQIAKSEKYVLYASIENAANAEIACLRGHVDLILMDVRMPVMDGYEATRRIRGLERGDAKSVPILAMTADAFAEDVARTKQCGMNGHLTKPLEVQTLNQEIRRALQSCL